MGWIITVAYFVAAFLCWRAGLAEKKQSLISEFPKNYWLWFGLAAVLLVLGINKQLDLQTLLISLGRGIAIECGWYDSRRQIQIDFVLLAALFSSIFFLGLMWRFKGCWRQYWLILSGLLFIALFVLIRAASFNHVDYLLSKWRIIGPFKMKYVAELGGIMLVGAGAYYRRFKVQRLKDKG